jgi:hypothetical protein
MSRIGSGRSQGGELTMRLVAPLARRLCLIASVLLPLLGSDATADPTDPVSVTLPPEDQGDAFVPGFREVADLEQDYVEEEFFVSGAARLFNYAHNPPLGPTDTVAIQENVPYETRIIVRRPAQAGHFNGSVVVEWWNTTAGFETAPAWDASAEYFAREGYVYVGVTNANQGLSFLTGGCSLFGVLPPTCGTRYSTLSLPDDGVAYEMVSQIANLLKSDSPDNPLPAGYDVERLYHVGQSQQGGSMVTYASGFHFDGNDGYFVQQAASARRINAGPSCEDPDSQPYPDCTPRLQGSDRLVRTDLPVPVYHAITETDIEILFGIVARQDDTPTFRYYEVAGGGHLIIHLGVEVIPGLFLEDLCEFPLNTTADGPVFFSYTLNAMWDNMEKQVRKGRVPPVGVQMDVDLNTGDVLRDVYGNGLGGVRLPSMEVPTATYIPGNQADPNLPLFLQQIGNLACFLASSVVPFDEATLDELYPNHGSYVSQVAHATNALSMQGLLLPKDAQKIRDTAVHSTIGCGIGFELALLLPPLMWLKRLRGRGRG